MKGGRWNKSHRGWSCHSQQRPLKALMLVNRLDLEVQRPKKVAGKDLIDAAARRRCLSQTTDITINMGFVKGFFFSFSFFCFSVVAFGHSLP